MLEDIDQFAQRGILPLSHFVETGKKKKAAKKLKCATCPTLCRSGKGPWCDLCKRKAMRKAIFGSDPDAAYIAKFAKMPFPVRRKRIRK